VLLDKYPNLKAIYCFLRVVAEDIRRLEVYCGVFNEPPDIVGERGKGRGQDAPRSPQEGRGNGDGDGWEGNDQETTYGPESRCQRSISAFTVV